MNIRPAYSTDAATLAYLTNLSSEGMSARIWEHLAEGEETPVEAGARFIAREDGIFSYQNTMVLADGHQVVGLVSGRHLQGSNQPERLDEFLPFIRPLIKLERKVQGSWNITALALDESIRQRGAAAQLLETVEQRARVLGLTQMSAAVANENPEACNLFSEFGYEVIADEPFVRFEQCMHNGLWLMMVKAI